MNDGSELNPLLIVTEIDFDNLEQMKYYTALMADALDTLQQQMFVDSGGMPPQRFDKIFALEQTGRRSATLIEVAMPSPQWVDAAETKGSGGDDDDDDRVDSKRGGGSSGVDSKAGDAESKASDAESKSGDAESKTGLAVDTAAKSGAGAEAAAEEEDPDSRVVLGRVPGGICCRGWVGGDFGVPAGAKRALTKRGVNPATKLAGFCYGDSLHHHCDLFIFHQLYWEDEETMQKYVVCASSWLPLRARPFG